jgi:hypothetical protein
MNEIKNIIQEGLTKDIVIAERCLKLNKKISQFHNKTSDKIKKDISLILYDLSYTEMVLSLSRIFDIPDKKYPTRCIKKLHQIARQEILQDEIKKNKAESILNLKYFGFWSDFINLLKDSSDLEFIDRSTGFFESLEINEPIAGNIIKLKTIRDKLLAHNEDIDLDTLIPYKLTENLIEYAKNVVSFYFLTYCGIHLKPGNKYALDHISLKWERIYKNFIEN